MGDLRGSEATRACRTAPGSATCTCRSRTARGRGLLRGGAGLRYHCAHYPGALFISAGGYHHHIGPNTWAQRRGAGASHGLAGAPALHDRAARRGRARARAGSAGGRRISHRAHRRRRPDGRPVGQSRTPDDRSGDGLAAPALPAHGRRRDRRRRGDRYQHRVPPRRGGRARRAAARAGGAGIRLHLASGRRRAGAVLRRAEHPHRRTQPRRVRAVRRAARLGDRPAPGRLPVRADPAPSTSRRSSRAWPCRTVSECRAGC